MTTRGPSLTSRKALAAVAVVAVIARNFLRNGLDGALGSITALAVGALVLSLLVAAAQDQGPGPPAPPG